MANVTIRPATALDAPIIVELVKKLAAYENQPVDRVRLTEKAVIRDGFGGSPRFEVLLAELDRKVAGLALFFFNYSTWEGQPGIYVEDLFVEERARKLGVGRTLMGAIARIARERGCSRITLSVLDWNPAREFYSRLGFAPTSGWLQYALGGDRIVTLSEDG